MSQFLESIKIKDGFPCNLDWHQSRLNKTFQKFFPQIPAWQLTEIICPQNLNLQQVYKCRLIYDQQRTKIEYLPYQRTNIKSFKLVDIGEFEYPYKFADRSFFQEIKNKHKDAEEFILIKSGMITDTTYSNLVFQNEQGLFTPSVPLLPGTMRAKLLSLGQIKLAKIGVKDLSNYKNFYLINALLGEDLQHPYAVDVIIG